MNTETTNDVLPYVKFLFEIDNPSLEECYQYGYQMSVDGALEEDNPYAGRGEKEAEYWQQGWWDACYGIEPMFAFEPSAQQTVTPVDQALHWVEETAANEGDFEEQVDSKITTISKIAAVLAGAFLSYQVLDMIA